MKAGENQQTVPNVLEQAGLNQLRRWNGRSTSESRRLDPKEMAALRRVERWTVAWAALAGTISGGILGVAEVIVRRWFLEETEAGGWREQLAPWTGFMALTLVVTGVEILFLYWNALRGVGRGSALAGLGCSQVREDSLVARGLVRAALELPETQESIWGIDPYARTSRWKITIRRILYRVKVGVSSFFFRVVLRRLLGRAALRFAIPLAAIPLFAIWNGFITWRIMRQARIRALGPLAVGELGTQLRKARPHLDRRARRLMLEALGELIIRSQNNHPNFVLLLGRMLDEFGFRPEEVQVDWTAHREGVRELQEREQKTLAQVLSVGAVVDGRIGGAEEELLAQVHALCQQPFPRQRLDQMRAQFLNGQGVGLEV